MRRLIEAMMCPPTNTLSIYAFTFVKATKTDIKGLIGAKE
ncbi:hypothetical protein AA0312_2160 [Acetobacter tropicalis NRIC 0312]|nr:hypothetical protein ATR1_413c0003 [Acetobacter tropicalis]GBR71104.1 hypothetical protein AA0312_2160 [Acetobacter tropicalis NRIC 0312]